MGSPAGGERAVWRDLSSPVSASSPLYPIYRRYRRFIPVVVFAGLFATAMEGIAISLMVPLLGLLLSSGALPDEGSLWTGLLATVRPDTRIVSLVALIFVFIAAKNVVSYANQSLIAWIESQIGQAIRTEMSRHILDMDYPSFLTEEPSRILNIMTGESWRAADVFRHYMVAIAGLAAVVAFLLMMGLLNWRLTLAVLGGALLIRWFENRMVSRTAHLSEAVTAANTRFSASALTMVSAMRMIRLFGQEKREEQKFATVSHGLRRATFDVWLSGNLVSPVIEILYTGLFSLILIVAVMVDGAISLPHLAAFLILLQRMQPHLRVVEQARVQFAGSSSGLREVERLLLRAAPARLSGAGRPAPALAEGIVFDNVSYHFPGQRSDVPALDHVSFRIEAGRTTALVGPSGAGKSTIVNLVCRLLEPTAGRITVDGIPLADMDVSSWRDRIAISGQDMELIDGTIAENIAYGVADADMDAVAEAARLADAASFIANLPHGYQTVVGHRGLTLSGGQRQRISLARAFARNAQVLILDEATNAIDGMSEEVILSLLAEGAPNLTVLVISHRASSLVNCERWIELADGKVKVRD